MDCILHIGIGKAGSSSLQDLFQKNRNTLKEQGVIYPKDLLPSGRTGGDNHKCLAVSAMLPQRKNFVLNQHRAITPSARAVFDAKVEQLYKSQIEKNPDALFLLSAEHFWSCLGHKSEVASLRDKMVRLGLNVTRIIVYVRRQSDWFESFLNQRIREGRGLLGRDAETLIATPTASQLNYETLINTWEQYFPKASVIPRIFTREAMINSDIVDDFCDAAGIATVPHQSEKKNVTAISNTGINTMLKMREKLDVRLGKKLENSAWRRLAATIDELLPGRCAILSEEDMRAIDYYYRKSNEAVRKRFFNNRSQLFSDVYQERPQEVFSPIDRKDFDDLLNFSLEMWLQNEKLR